MATVPMEVGVPCESVRIIAHIIVTSNNDKTFALCIVINIIRCQGCRAKSLCPRLSLHVARQGDVLLGYLYSLFRIDIFAISNLADGY